MTQFHHFEELQISWRCLSNYLAVYCCVSLVVNPEAARILVAHAAGTGKMWFFARNSRLVQHMISAIFCCPDCIQKYLFPTLVSLCMRPSSPILAIPGHQGPNINPPLHLYISIFLSFNK